MSTIANPSRRIIKSAAHAAAFGPNEGLLFLVSIRFYADKQRRAHAVEACAHLCLPELAAHLLQVMLTCVYLNDRDTNRKSSTALKSACNTESVSVMVGVSSTCLLRLAALG